MEVVGNSLYIVKATKFQFSFCYIVFLSCRSDTFMMLWEGMEGCINTAKMKKLSLYFSVSVVENSGVYLKMDKLVGFRKWMIMDC